MHQKYIFKCSSEAPGRLTFKFATKEQMVVIISNNASNLKTKQLQTIYNDIIIVPERVPTDGSRTKSPRTKPPGQNPPGQNPPDKIPLDKIPPRTKSPRTKSPGQNPPIISPQTVPLLNTFCFIEMLFSKASFLPPLLDVIYSMVMKWRSEAERSR